jgi:hypothetical protein
MRLCRILILLIIALSTALEATAQKPKEKNWLDSWREATVALVGPGKTRAIAPNGTIVEGDSLVIKGTGVILSLPGEATGLPWLVTAKHVFFNPQIGWDPDSLYIRFSWFESRPLADYAGIRIVLKEGSRHLWIPHPDPSVDLVAIPLRITISEAGKDKVAVIPLGNFAEPEDVFEGVPVLILGYPAAAGAEFLTRALVRSGSIAWVNPEDPVKSPILIDANLFPGNSGGPAFSLPMGINKEGGLRLGGKIAFLGIVSLARVQTFPILFEGKQTEAFQSAQLISIGILVPAGRILELLELAKK